MDRHKEIIEQMTQDAHIFVNRPWFIQWGLCERLSNDSREGKMCNWLRFKAATKQLVYAFFQVMIKFILAEMTEFKIEAWEAF